METASALTTFLSSIGTTMSSYVSWMGDIGQAIVSQPILLVGCALPIFGGAAGLFKRLFNM